MDATCEFAFSNEGNIMEQFMGVTGIGIRNGYISDSARSIFLEIKPESSD